MIIKRIEIDNFGGLSNCSFDLKDGFNMIFGSNGKGKSTLMSFIKMMLYSKAGNEKSSDLLKNTRRKYIPLSGSPMSGAIIFEHEGCEYHLHKTFGKSPSSDKTALRNITTGKAVSLSATSEIGESFLGITVSEFERSVFIDKTGGFSSDVQDFGLERRISNLVSSGEEQTSGRIVLDRLASAKEELISKSGKKGLIVELENEISALQSKKDMLISSIREQSEITMQISLLENEIQQDEKQLQNLELAQKSEKLKQQLKVYKLLLDKLYALDKAEAELKTAADLVKSNKSVFNAISLKIIAVILAVVFISAGIFISKWFYFGVILSMLLVIIKPSQNNNQSELQILTEKTDRLKYDIETIVNTANISDPTVAEIENKIKKITDFINTNPDITVDKNVSPLSVRQKHIKLNELYRRQSLPDGSEEDISRHIAEKTLKLKNLKNRYDSLCIAESVMEGAVAETDSSLGTFLSKRTGEYLNVLNDKKNNDVLVSDSLDIELKNTENSSYYQWKYLSDGFIDRTYLALRLAVADAVADEKNSLPLFLDDILSQYDDNGCERALLLLKNRREACGGQILLFTCHDSILNISKELFQDLNVIYV